MISYIFLALIGLLAILFPGLMLWTSYKDGRSKQSWDISWMSGRGEGEPGSIKYSEEGRYLFLYGSLDKNGILMPDRLLLEANMPEFWKDKWALIKERVETYSQRNTTVILTNSIEEILRIVCFDENLPTGDTGRIVSIKFTNNTST